MAGDCPRLAAAGGKNPLAAQAAAELRILEAVPDLTSGQIVIKGLNFGTAPGQVWLNDISLTPVVSWSDTMIVAALPHLAPGSYELKVEKSPSATGRDEFEVTLVAAETGTGTVTSVGSGPGLTGAPITTSGSLELDTGFTDARYAAIAHGHDVSQVTNAATLFSNLFTGDQTVQGNIAAHFGHFTVTFGGGTGLRGEALVPAGEQGFGVVGYTSGTMNVSAGVAGHATSAVGQGTGVHGEAAGDGWGVRGIASHPQFGTGVGAFASGDVAVAMRAEYRNAAGIGSALDASVNSPTATPGVFDNYAGGNVLIGRVSGAERFRVDGTGAVYAASYRDLAGNPIPSGTGDITGVAAGTGLTGGGTSGDVRVGTGTLGCVKDADATVIAGTCSSDARLKKNVGPIGPVLDRLARLTPVEFDWDVESHPDYHFGRGRSFGLIAQDVERSFPDLVTEDPNGFKAVRYSKIPLLLLKAVAELREEGDTKTTALEARLLELIDGQQAQIARLLAEIEVLKADSRTVR